MTEAFYLDGQLYDAMWGCEADDLEFYLRQADQAQGPVLELACGTGRLTLPLARQRVDITGLDLQPSMLAQAKRKADAEGLKIEWVQADIRDCALGRRFKLIFIPFNSLLHLHDAASHQAFFACARKHLAPDGRLIVDVFNPDPARLVPNTERLRVLDFIEPERGEAAWIDSLRRYDSLTQVNRSTWYCSTATRPDYLVHQLDLRCIFPQELQTLVRANGFEVEEAFGDHAGAPLTSASLLQILKLKLAKLP